MTSSDPVGQVDPDLAEAERWLRLPRSFLDPRTVGAVRTVMAEYDRMRAAIEDAHNALDRLQARLQARRDTLAREAASLRAELSRSRAVVQAAVAYINQGGEGGEVSAASVGRALTRDSELRAALAAAVREAKR